MLRRNRLFVRSMLVIVRLESTSPLRSRCLGTLRHAVRGSSPGTFAPMSMKNPKFAMRTILPSQRAPSRSSSSSLRGGGAGDPSEPAGSWRRAPEAAQSRPPSRPSESARGARLRQPTRAPCGSVAPSSSMPSECERAKRQHSRYSEIERGMIRIACDRRRPRGLPCLPSRGPPSRPRWRSPSTSGSDRKRTRGRSPRCAKASTLSLRERRSQSWKWPRSRGSPP
mmetsp:Transcript_38452/g.99348  ORF Transcript_38452/g.99348 Transcript_38452/m.99348 type:complete len:225 (-) Transcript_38452:46-720(-)